MPTSKRSPRGGRDQLSQVSPQLELLALGKVALDIAKTARRNRKSLSGTNFYANKLADARVDATNAFQRLSGGSVGDTSALAELVETVFAADAKPKDRAQALRDLQFEIKTKWKEVSADQSDLESGAIFPLVTLTETGRGYLVSVGRQVNGAFASNWFDACAVMMRRLLESSIIEAFEGNGIDQKIKDPASGDFLQLSGLIDASLKEQSWNLPRGVRTHLKDLRDLGHRSAHNRYYLAKKTDIDRLSGYFRESVETFLHLAKLL